MKYINEFPKCYPCNLCTLPIQREGLSKRWMDDKGINWVQPTRMFITYCNCIRCHYENDLKTSNV